MHQGTFPDNPHPPQSRPEEFQRGPWSPDDLESPAPRTTRRVWLAAVGGLVVGAGASVYLVSHRGSADRQPTELPARAARGSLAWAHEHATCPVDELIRDAGDLQRVALQHRNDSRLPPIFKRLLEVCLDSTLPDRDEAGACAVLVLARLDRMDLLADRIEEIGRRADLPAMARAVEAAREDADRRIGRGR